MIRHRQTAMGEMHTGRDLRLVRAMAGTLLVLALTAGAGTDAATPDPRNAAELPPIGPKSGLLPPAIILFDEAAGGKTDPAPDSEASSIAAAAMRAAFLAAMAERNPDLRLVEAEEIGPVDLSALIALPGRLDRDDAHPPRESLLSVDYPAGSIHQAMERLQIDSVWILSGIVILPEIHHRATVQDEAPPTATTPRSRLLLRVALVDANGIVRFSDLVDEGPHAIIRHGGKEPAEIAPADLDLRDPGIARRWTELLLAQYTTEGERRQARQAVTGALEVESEGPRHPHPHEVRLGVGVFVFAGLDFWAGYLPKESGWQFGYRFVRWTDSFEDPYTGNELTETTETLQGGQVNYLFRPEKRGTWYVGASLMQWSKTEYATMNGVSDTTGVFAPFLGGGYTRHLGTHAYWNTAMFLAPWADLSTDTGVSSEDSSGGFDIQIQLGASF